MIISEASLKRVGKFIVKTFKVNGEKRSAVYTSDCNLSRVFFGRKCVKDAMTFAKKFS